MSDRSQIAKLVIEILSGGKLLKAKDLAIAVSRLYGSEIDKKELNSILNGQDLKGLVQCDSQYRWSLSVKTKTENSPAPTVAPQAKSEVVGKLERLTSYYLKCLSYERDGEISLYPPKEGFREQYLQVKKHPVVSESFHEIWSSDESKDFVSHLRRDPTKHLLYVGYPTFLRPSRSGARIEPLFLFAIGLPDRNSATPVLLDEPPRFNQAAFEGYGPVNGGHLFDELIFLQQELGLVNESGEIPEIDDWLTKLQTIRPEWPWATTMDANNLSIEAVHELEAGKIHNCAIICSNTQATYTRGLETELTKLNVASQVPGFESSALFSLLQPQADTSRTDSSNKPLLEILRLNKEQRLAVDKALNGKITVITGPPGTGKSQVVAAILANAALRGWRSLVASKNHKAVDVVEARTNALAASPFLLRLGGISGSQNLAQQITHILSSSNQPTKSDLERIEKEYQSLLEERLSHEKEIERVVELRNEVDALDRELASVRRRYEPEVLNAIRSTAPSSFAEIRRELSRALMRADRFHASFFGGLFWNFISKKRQSELESSVSQAHRAIEGLRLSEVVDKKLDAEELIERLVDLEKTSTAFASFATKLEQLKNAVPLEKHYAKFSEVDELVVEKGAEYWRAYLDQRYASLTQEDRRLLGEYTGILSLVTQANLQNSPIAEEVRKQFNTLTSQVAHIFTASAITSLSAQGRIPFQPASLDIVIIDEASQCDIASALPLLLRAERVVVIGDPQQLSHITQISARLDATLLEEYGLQAQGSWGYSQNSLFMMTAANCRGEDVVSLVEHHRSDHDIIGFSNNFFYRNKLRVATRSSRLKHRGKEPAIEWINVSGRVNKIYGKGAVNDEEAQEIAKFVEDLIVKRGYKGSVGIVTPFRGQANRIRDHLAKIENLDIGSSELLVDTVHKFQGDERDLMIFSPVVSDGISQSALGFLSAQGNLFNVAITRARSRLVVIGNKNACAESSVGYLSAFVRHADQVSFQLAHKSHEQPSGLPDYPTVTNPELVSDWERRFYKALHAAGIRTMIPQYQVDEYRLDFAIVDGDRKLNIEVDGELYHRNWDGHLVLRDQLRNRRLVEQGWSVLRFWVYEIRDHEADCIERVRKWLSRAS